MDIPEYCKAHRTAVIPDPDNCAKYYNCTYTQHQECKYPGLYNPNTRSCDKFTSVSCDHRQEPQAPCKYHVTLRTTHFRCIVSNKYNVLIGRILDYECKNYARKFYDCKARMKKIIFIVTLMIS